MKMIDTMVDRCCEGLELYANAESIYHATPEQVENAANNVDIMFGTLSDLIELEMIGLIYETPVEMYDQDIFNVDKDDDRDWRGYI